MYFVEVVALSVCYITSIYLICLAVMFLLFAATGNANKEHTGGSNNMETPVTVTKKTSLTTSSFGDTVEVFLCKANDLKDGE